MELVEASAVDALDCAPGDAVLELGSSAGHGPPGSAFELNARPTTRRLEPLTTSSTARSPRRRRRRLRRLARGDRHALAHVVLSPTGDPRGALGVVRAGRRSG